MAALLFLGSCSTWRHRSAAELASTIAPPLVGFFFKGNIMSCGMKGERRWDEGTVENENNSARRKGLIFYFQRVKNNGMTAIVLVGGLYQLN
ncbi:hypothetical protein [Desulforamulus reducens]|uniref:hypothetical protein n=1 Tax=Desulforamulus reducens TaxID=59610 RepID=UPI0012EA1047|nr:hypothetical protein [Desulforamulus reducens]